MLFYHIIIYYAYGKIILIKTHWVFFVDLTTWEETVDNMFLLFIQYEKMHLGLVFKIMHYDIARKAF